MVSVRTLGPCCIAARRPIGKGLLGKSRELASFLSLRPDGARREVIIDTLWQDVDPRRTQDRLSTSVSCLRQCVRQSLRRPDVNVILCIGDLYQLNTDLVDVDLWRFQAALKRANTILGDELGLLEALYDARLAYGGDFGADEYWPWAEVPRQTFRVQALDTAVRIADLECSAGRPERALASLTWAIEIDPYGEEFYTRAAQLLVDVGREDSARRLIRMMNMRLAELDGSV